MSLRSLVLVALTSTSLIACAGQSDPASESSTTESAEGSLQITMTAEGTKGTFVSGGETVSFESVAQKDGIFEVDIKLRGVMLDATIDRANGATSMDAFAIANGGDTQISEGDRELLMKFLKATSTVVSVSGHESATMMRRVASLWSQTSDTLKVDRRVLGEEGRTWTSLCSYLGKTYRAQHDCSSGGFSAAVNQVNAYVGYYGSTTYYSRSGTWSTSAYVHAGTSTFVPLEYGECFGRCGGGCDPQSDYTVDCHNHDSCVRGNHSIASMYCNDQFSSASDDELYAPVCTTNSTHTAWL
jgi:hypothetical protein